MRLPRTYLIARHLFEAQVAILLGFVILAILIPEVDRARDAARRAVCVNNLRQHSGSHPDVVYLKQGRITGVSSCWACGTRPDVHILFIEEGHEGDLPNEQLQREGFSVLIEALGRLRQYKLDRGVKDMGDFPCRLRQDARVNPFPDA